MKPALAMRAQRSLVSLLVLLGLSAPRLYSQQVMQLRNQIWGNLHAVILDRDSARPVPARCYLTGSDGRNWVPSGAITYVKPPEFDFIASGEFQVSLPPGQYTLRVERGTEFRRVRRAIEIRPGEIHEERIH